MTKCDVLIIGAGAAGLMCAAVAIGRGKRVIVLEKSRKAGKKILISGGGRCNFTNQNITAEAYLSDNSHFCKSALARFTQWDFMALMTRHNLGWSVEKSAQLFCKQKAGAVLAMLVRECEGARIILGANIDKITAEDGYLVASNYGELHAKSLVIATGGASIPKMGATDFGLTVAAQFGLKTVRFTPGLVPFVFSKSDIQRYFSGLSGVAVAVRVSCGGATFAGAMLITHFGLSGPAMLQISSYWRTGAAILIDLLPDFDAEKWLFEQQKTQPKSYLSTALNAHFSKRFALKLTQVLTDKSYENWTLAQMNKTDLTTFARALNGWILHPQSTQGMRTAEVCLGGVSTGELSSKTFEAHRQKGLYFIGETLDVTGHLGGYNFQWAWSSGWAAGQVVG